VTAAPPVPALYQGDVVHSRNSPITHRFRYPVCYWLVDIDQGPQPTGILRFLTGVDARDHVNVRALLGERGLTADRVIMLAMARTLGYVFNPISVFWCYDAGGTRVAVLAEVNNTYGARHTYVLDVDDHGSAVIDKAMYVSPFYPVDGHYRFRVSEPTESLMVSVMLQRADDEPFVATLRGERRSATFANVLRSALRYPAARTSALIRWQGVRRWRRGWEVLPR
jgi:DUF1365 family protein